MHLVADCGRVVDHDFFGDFLWLGFRAATIAVDPVMDRLVEEGLRNQALSCLACRFLGINGLLEH